MTHLWVRAEQRPNEERVGLTAEGAKALIEAGIKVTVEESSVRAEIVHRPAHEGRVPGQALHPEQLAQQ